MQASPHSKILCVEDDRTMQILIQGSLQEDEVHFASTLKEAKQALSSEQFDALLLDILLPDGDGLQFWSEYSSAPEFQSIPVLFLTGHSDISNKVKAFSLGAEDFISKPFDPQELNARMKRRLRAKTRPSFVAQRGIGNIQIDLDQQRVLLVDAERSSELGLTTIEFKILSLLSKKMNQVFSRTQILESCWSAAHVSDRTVDSHIAHLRNKLVSANVEIRTVKNSGYKLSMKTEAALGV